MRLVICLGLSILLAGCAANSSGYYTQSVLSWRGGSVSDLAKVWGRPDQTMAVSGGNTTFVYKRQSFVSTNQNFSPSVGVHSRNGGTSVITSTPNINTPWNKGFAPYCLAAFTATPAGKIIDTNIQGANCYISQNGALRLANPNSGKK